LKKEQIDTLFVRVRLLQGGFWGGWVVQRGSHPFMRGVPLLFFFCPPASPQNYVTFVTFVTSRFSELAPKTM